MGNIPPVLAQAYTQRQVSTKKLADDMDKPLGVNGELARRNDILQRWMKKLGIVGKAQLT